MFTLDSIEFDTTYRYKNQTKPFSIDLKNLKKVTSKCNGSYCWLATESGTPYTIQDKQAVQYRLYFSWPACKTAENVDECSQSAWLAAALNRLHAYANSHPADARDFHQLAAAWRDLTAKPSVPEEIRVFRTRT